LNISTDIFEPGTREYFKLNQKSLYLLKMNWLK